ncbi:MAG: TenA family protein [Chloroflexi bacterium]|nr:TenA family protein [Chloroflexota bacterium]
MSLSGQLWQQNAALARAALDHPFVRTLADATLPRPLFEQYILQDAFFLEAFARAYALALAQCPDRDGLQSFFALLSGTIDELHLHASYAERWGIADQLANVVAAPATLAYTDFLLATAALGSVGETCAAMTPCMRLYAFVGQSLAASAVEANPYIDWIRTYASSEFEALASRLEHLLDRYGQPHERVSDLYRRAMQLELAFFDAAYAGTAVGAAR